MIAYIEIKNEATSVTSFFYIFFLNLTKADKDIISIIK